MGHTTELVGLTKKEKRDRDRTWEKLVAAQERLIALAEKQAKTIDTLTAALETVEDFFYDLPFRMATDPLYQKEREVYEAVARALDLVKEEEEIE